MEQSDRLEFAIAEIERLRAKQDAEFEAAFAALAELGATPVEVDGEQLRHLAECSEPSPSAGNLSTNPPITSFGRC